MKTYSLYIVALLLITLTTKCQSIRSKEDLVQAGFKVVMDIKKNELENVFKLLKNSNLAFTLESVDTVIIRRGKVLFDKFGLPDPNGQLMYFYSDSYPDPRNTKNFKVTEECMIKYYFSNTNRYFITIYFKKKNKKWICNNISVPNYSIESEKMMNRLEKFDSIFPNGKGLPPLGEECPPN